jgi:glycerate kinase
MKILCAPNALKGTVSAEDAALAIAEGVRAALPSARIATLPIADGGDGTRAILVAALGGKTLSAQVSDPLGRPITASYGLVEDGRTAVLDVASASGLALLAVTERDPFRTTSFGTGELLLAALDRGATEVVLGVGGSATVDGGLGLLRALGVELLDGRGQPVANGGAGLLELATIDATRLPTRVRTARITIACDVDNPLLGPEGAAPAFAPQKGAHARGVRALEAGLEHLARVLERSFGGRVGDVPFGGAAGGIAASLRAVLGAELVSGIDLVLDRVAFDQELAGTDLVVTAEGRLDAGSLRNKGPVGVARRALAHGVPTLALAGSIDPALDLGATPFVAVHELGSRGEGARGQATGAELSRAASAAVSHWAKR